MRNKKGFTLVELLGVIVILGVLMLVAIPNTVSLIDKNKKGSYIEDARTFISLVKNKVQVDKKLELPIDGSSVFVMTLGYLNTNDIKDSPYGNEYSKDASFVAIALESNKYVYYVHLISCNEDNCDTSNYNAWEGIQIVKESDLNGDNKYDLVKSENVAADLIEGSNIQFETVLNNKTVCINEDACVSW